MSGTSHVPSPRDQQPTTFNSNRSTMVTTTGSEKSDEACGSSSTILPTNTSLLNVNGLTTDAQSTSQATFRPPTLSEIISQEFLPFDADALIAKPFIDSETADERFEEELNKMLFEAIMEMYAWAAARPRHEASVASQLVNTKLVTIEQVEKEQEQTRRRLAEFVEKIRSAVEALL